MKLEVIATSLEDIKEINNSNADRIEFCSHLEVGGLTPPYEEIQKAGEISRLPVMVMVRPHANGYTYSHEDFIQILKDTEFIVNKTKAAGIVIGMLTTDDQIDIPRLNQILKITKSKKKQVTFHRAFQEVENPESAWKILEELGVNRILTSGTADINQQKARVLLEKLHSLSNNLLLLVGGGVHLNNLVSLKNVADEIHVGTAVRAQNNWNSPISIQKIAEFKKLLNSDHS